MKINGNEVRTGNILEYQGRLMRATKVHIVQMGNWRSYLQVELKDIRDGTKLNERIRPADVVERVQLDEKKFQFLYKEGGDLVFMDQTNYEQVTISADLIGSAHDLMKDMLGALDISVERVIITELRSSTYYAELHLLRGNERTIVSSRPSDAVAVAVRTESPARLLGHTACTVCPTMSSAWNGTITS